MSADPTYIAMMDRARGQVLALQRTLGIAQAPAPIVSAKDFSLRRAILLAIGGIDEAHARVESLARDEYKAAGYKQISPRSFFVSPRVILYHLGVRTLQPYQTTVSGSGAELVEMTLRDQSFIDALRPRSVVLQLGAQTIGGLRGDIQIPRQDTTSTAYWLSASGSPVESGAITESEGTFDSSPLQVAPCQVGGYSKISRLLMQQAPLADFVIANDFTRVLGTALDVAAIAGAGSSGAPLGVINQTGINTASGASFSYATSVSALTDLTTANAVINRSTLGWTINATSAGLLAQRQQVSGFPRYIMEPNADTGTINGHAALGTTNVPSGTAVFGDWSQVLILVWGDLDAPIEIEASPYGSGYAAGDVQIRAMFSANVAIRHPQSFTAVTGIT